MADLSSNDDGDTGPHSGHGPVAAVPQWVKVLAIIAVAFALLFAVAHLAGLGLGGHTLLGHRGGTPDDTMRPQR
jgi:hypothetical protein